MMRYRNFFICLILFVFSSVFAYADKSNVGRIYFTRASLWSENGESSSVNYKQGEFIPVGTTIKILDYSDENIEFLLVENNEKVVFLLDPRMSFLTIDQVFTRYFDSVTPEDSGIYNVFNEEEIEAIKKGKIVKGMSKAAVLMAYGYPPSHKTNIDKDDTWTYWLSPSQIQIIKFVDGSLTEIYPTPGESILKETKTMPPVKVDIKFFDQFDNEILKKKRDKAKEKYRVIPSELSYSKVVADVAEIETIDLKKVITDLPLGGSIADVGHWCREQAVSVIDNISLDELKLDIYKKILPVGVDKDHLNQWGYGAISHALGKDGKRLNYNNSDYLEAQKKFKLFSNPKMVYYGQTYFLSNFRNLKYGDVMANSRYTLSVRESPKFKENGINKIIFYFERKFDDLVLYATEVYFASTPDEYIKTFDRIYAAHNLIPGDNNLPVKKWFDNYISSIVLDPVPETLLSYTWGDNLFMVPDATLLEYTKNNVEFYRTRVFDSYFLNSLGLGHRSHYKILFIDDSWITG